MKKAFFLDRDGVVNTEVDYLSDPEKVEIIPGVVEALREIHRHGYLAIVVTNQSGVARGMYEESDVHQVHERIQQMIAPEKIDAFYYCPHHPECTGTCDCRKPLPGMLERAAIEYDIELTRSFMIGDRLSDLGAGRAANCAGVMLVKTGYGETVLAKGVPADTPIAADLLDAVHKLLTDER